MRCKTCDYPLWNLPARKCPECGADFKPSDFHFVPNSVKFLCPHCEQQYYGTTEHGHLIPRTFNCVNCAQRIDMDEMLLQPGEGVEESRTAADVMPWLQRKHFGWFKGMARTVGMSMVSPQRLMRAVPLEGGTGEACLFALIINGLIALLGVGLPFAAIGLVMALSHNRGAAEMFGTSVGSVVGGTAGMIILATLWALLTHGLLRISGGAERGVGRSMQAMYYSSGANLLLAVPCLGPYCGGAFVWVWWMVSAILMIMEGQRVRGLRATLCVGAGPLLAGVGFAAYIVLIAAFVSRTTVAATTIGPVPSRLVAGTDAQSIASGLLAYAVQHNGQAPPHGVQLVADNFIQAANLAIWQINHDEANVPVAGMTLDAFQRLPPNRMQITAQIAASLLPPNVVAHRLGDVVFTYHGVNLAGGSGLLWIAVMDPDPDQSASSGFTRIAMMDDGNIMMIPAGTMPAMLQAQNAVRAQVNLPPLPDPATVTHAAPAVASGSPAQP